MRRGKEMRAVHRGGKRVARRNGKKQNRVEAATQGAFALKGIVCGAIFVALIALKLVMPGHLSALRGTLAQWLVHEADFVSAFSALGRAAGGEVDWDDSLSEAYVAVFGGEESAREVSGELLGVTVAEQDADVLAVQRALPSLAVGEQRILGFAYVSPLSGTVTSGFGWRDDPNGGGECFHYGVDIAGEEGAEIVCFADGTVGAVGSSTIFGNYVTVNHADGFSTLYAHCSAITASAGQSVRRGEGIATVGATGNATGTHLHFEVHDGNEYLNPVYYVVF